MKDRTDRRGHLLAAPSMVGLAASLVLVAIAYTPSLLPRPWLMQGVIAGIAMAAGYGVGVFCVWVARRFTRWRPSPSTRRTLWICVLAAAVAVFAAAVLIGTAGQNEVRELLHMGSVGEVPFVESVPATLLVAFVILLASRGLRHTGRRFGHLLERWLPHDLSAVLGGLVTAVVVLVVLSLLVQVFYAVSESMFGKKNDTTLAGVTQPTSPQRSGSSASLVSWESLGYEGRNFVGPQVRRNL